MTKPWEETWEHVSGAWPYNVLRVSTAEKIADVWATGQEDGNGTADLIAQAPAMARKLLELQWAGNAQVGIGDGCDSVCPACDGAAPGSLVGGPQGHYPDCSLVAVLRAAGVMD